MSACPHQLPPAAPDAATGSAADLGPLPTWRLEDLYPGPESAELKADLEDAEQRATALHDAHANGSKTGSCGLQIQWSMPFNLP